MNHTFSIILQNSNEANASVPSHCSEAFEQNYIHKKKAIKKNAIGYKPPA